MLGSVKERTGVKDSNTEPDINTSDFHCHRFYCAYLIPISDAEVIKKYLSINLTSGFMIFHAVLIGGHINAMSNPR